MENDVMILRLVTGEDIICNLHKISTDKYLVCDPMMLIVKFKGKDSTVLMEHWLPVEVIKSNEIVLQSKDIITTFEPKESMAEYYTNLVEKLHRAIERKKLLESMDPFDMDEILEAMEESRFNSIH